MRGLLLSRVGAEGKLTEWTACRPISRLNPKPTVGGNPADRSGIQLEQKHSTSSHIKNMQAPPNLSCLSSACPVVAAWGWTVGFKGDPSTLSRPLNGGRNVKNQASSWTSSKPPARGRKREDTEEQNRKLTTPQFSVTIMHCVGRMRFYHFS
ncbi:hypothetical protein AOLI_G00116950 [Acnodon oligacanthus]